MTGWLRSLNGETIHRPGCSHIGGFAHWRFADGHSEAWIRNLIATSAPWLRLCKVCCPPKEAS